MKYGEIIYPFLIYLLIVNLTAFLLVYLDKRRSVHKMMRVSERTFFILSAVGGAPLCYIGMKMFHHKTLKKKFMIGIPIIMTAQFTVFVFIAFFLLTSRFLWA